MKRLLGNLALVLGSLAAAFLAGEAAVRSLYAEKSVLFPRYHTGYQYGKYTLRGIRPNAEFTHTSVDGSWRFVTNSRGFRNAGEFAYDKPRGTVRLLSLGDSHTQGYEVRQAFTYTAVAERMLAARGVKAEGINAGVSGFRTRSAHSQAEVDLATALILRMNEVCKANGIRLIVADLPQRPEAHRFRSSLPAPMAQNLRAAGVELVSSEALLAPFDGAAEFHVPHGHQHISEFTHQLIGVEIARRVAGERSIEEVSNRH